MVDRFDEIAAILSRQPERDELDERANGLADSELAELMRQRQQHVADRMRTGARRGRTGSDDPVLGTLAALYRQRLDAESNIRLLLAYAREFVEPRPYRLVDLAQAAGMSVSGVRTAYTTDEIHQVARAIDRPHQTSAHLREDSP